MAGIAEKRRSERFDSLCGYLGIVVAQESGAGKRRSDGKGLTIRGDKHAGVFDKTTGLARTPQSVG